MLNLIGENEVKGECIIPVMQTLLSLMFNIKLEDVNEKHIFYKVLKNLLNVAEIDKRDKKVNIVKIPSAIKTTVYQET